MLKEKLGMDKKDVKIVSLFMQNPDISQTELADALSISQPSINARLRKLKRNGVLARATGIEFNRANMYMARVDFTAANPEKLLNELKLCSFFVNGFILSGSNNVSIMIVAHDLKKIESIIDKNLRHNEAVKNINMSVVVSAAKPFICEIDLEREHREECQNPGSCEDCKMHERIELK
ncbi:Lrp/AsnC family transcriptional regulator [Candidatus Woesearchaeota archaeon]|nr:MAG: Lrp/AsnC family transcriptional regulator [Candidatus Woesearchaeota archaeon]